MSWLRLDDVFLEHPKIVALSNTEKVTHLTAMLYAARHRTRGALPPAALRHMRVPPKQVERFVELNLWEFDDEGRLWIHDFAIYNSDTLEQRIDAYLKTHPGATANEIQRAIPGRRQLILDIIRGRRNGA